MNKYQTLYIYTNIEMRNVLQLIDNNIKAVFIYKYTNMKYIHIYRKYGRSLLTNKLGL